MDSNIEMENCPICLDNMDKESANAIKLECNHFFHNECIVKWLSMDNTICPLCKKRVERFEELDLLPPPIIEIHIENQEIPQRNYIDKQNIIVFVITLILILYLANLQKEFKLP